MPILLRFLLNLLLLGSEDIEEIKLIYWPHRNSEKEYREEVLGEVPDQSEVGEQYV